MLKRKLKTKFSSKALPICLTINLVISMLIPAVAYAKSTDFSQDNLDIPKEFLKYKTLEKSEPKVNAKLYNQLEKDDKVTYLIKLNTQVDTDKVEKHADKKFKNLTYSSKEVAKRSEMVSILKKTANESQKSLKSILEKEKIKGNIDSYESFYIVNVMAVKGNKKALNKIAKCAEVEKILPNETRQIVDYEINKKNDNKVSTNSIEWNIDKVKAPKVWDMGIDGSGIVIASLDTGVQWDHPALKEKYRGYNKETGAVDNEFNWFDATANKEVPYDDVGHGTHTVGTMVGSEPNGNNKIGVAPGAKWIAVKAFTKRGGSDKDLLAAGEWILAPKDHKGNPHPEKAPNIVNNSWGGGKGLNEWYRDIVKAWRSAGIFPEFSAGNTTFFNRGGEGSVANPANYPESFATGAIDINDKVANFSLRGPSPYGKIKPDISAPGVNIRSSVPGSKYEGGWNGTSMAGPHVSAVVALLLQVKKDLTVDEIEKILINTATPLTDEKYRESPNNGYGYGGVNAYKAVNSIIQNNVEKEYKKIAMDVSY